MALPRHWGKPGNCRDPILGTGGKPGNSCVPILGIGGKPGNYIVSQHMICQTSFLSYVFLSIVVFVNRDFCQLYFLQKPR